MTGQPKFVGSEYAISTLHAIHAELVVGPLDVQQTEKEVRSFLDEVCDPRHVNGGNEFAVEFDEIRRQEVRQCLFIDASLSEETLCMLATGFAQMLRDNGLIWGGRQIPSKDLSTIVTLILFPDPMTGCQVRICHIVTKLDTNQYRIARQIALNTLAKQNGSLVNGLS